jgi:hypothetical protein
MLQTRFYYTSQAYKTFNFISSGYSVSYIIDRYKIIWGTFNIIRTYFWILYKKINLYFITNQLEDIDIIVTNSSIKKKSLIFTQNIHNKGILITFYNMSLVGHTYSIYE